MGETVAIFVTERKLDFQREGFKRRAAGGNRSPL
jgi:hypothetical protein